MRLVTVLEVLNFDSAQDEHYRHETQKVKNKRQVREGYTYVINKLNNGRKEQISSSEEQICKWNKYGMLLVSQSIT